MEKVQLNQTLQNIIVNDQLKLIDVIDFYTLEIEQPTEYNIGFRNGLEEEKKILIETVKEMEKKYNETL